MRRKFAQPALPNLYFRDGVLSVPGYIFEKVVRWEDTGSQTLLAEGISLKDDSNVLAKLAPAAGNGSICLEREAHLLNRLSQSSEAMGTTLRFIDFLSIPWESGDCVVLLLVHPGPNLLGRYFPPSKVNDLLLADMSRGGRPTSSRGDVYMAGVDEIELDEDPEGSDVMDLASFLEFAIQATHCLEVIHKAGVIHREVRANAFHLNAHSGLVRFAHFGNRSVSLEQLGGPSALVIQADALEEVEKRKVKDALCYLAPEQTGSVETSLEDHRTDLYSLGIMLWALLVGKGMMPFEGSPMEILYAIAQKRPMPVHEVRRDVPHLLAKSPDARYNSAYGLKADLMACQKRLLAAVSSMSEQSLELVPYFEIGLDDKYTNFTLPSTLFGREKELETIRNVIRQTSSSHAKQSAAFKGSLTITSTSSQHTGTATEDKSESATSSRSESSQNPLAASNHHEVSPKLFPAHLATVNEVGPSLLTPQGSSSYRTIPRTTSKNRTSRTRSVVVCGPAGAGKSSLIMVNQAKWRSHGLWGYAKFQKVGSAPFAALLACLSSALRQLMVFHSDVHRFVKTLKTRLGPQLNNVPLLYQGAPELKDVLHLFESPLTSAPEILSSVELRARFQSLVEQVFSVLAEIRLLALFLDDLQEADESTMDLVAALANSKSRMLLLVSVRSDEPGDFERVRHCFGSKSRVKWITLEPLTFSAISNMVSRTLHRSKEETLPLSRLVHRMSAGNAFSARNILMTLHRRKDITFDFDRNQWNYDILKIEASYVERTVDDPSDVTYLTSHLQGMPADARKYLTWASLFGVSFKATEVALMIDWEDSGGSSGSEDESEDAWNLSKAVSNMKEASLSTSRGSMRGLQIAIAEGWLVQRARDVCIFAHDKYRQAAIVEAESLPEETLAKMSFRIVLMLLHDNPRDPHRVAEHAKRCLSIIKEHTNRDEVLQLLIDAGISAWTTGAHELALESLLNARALLVDEHWEKDQNLTLSLLLKVAELLNWRGDIEESDLILHDILARGGSTEDKARVLRLLSRNLFSRRDFPGALDGTLSALATLGVTLSAIPTKKEADAAFDRVKNEILAVGFDNILLIPRATDSRVELTIQLLNDAATNAYWGAKEIFVDIIGSTTIQVVLRSGMCPGAALGFFWVLGAAAERRELYRFSADLGKLALRIADTHGTNLDKCRAYALYAALVSGYDNSHIRPQVARCDMAVKYGLSAGDRVYAGFGLIHGLALRLFVCEHLNELVITAEEALNDVSMWTPGSETIILGMGVLNCIRALAGCTVAVSAETAFNTDGFNEGQYLAHVIHTSGNISLALNWYNSFKVVGLFCLGFLDEAAELGFSVYETLGCHPNHRHKHFGLFYHSLAMIGCIRKGHMSDDRRTRYQKQIELNQTYNRKWLSPSPVNNSAWVALIDAEVASLGNSQQAFRLYDVAVKIASNHDWLLEEGWGLYLQGCHFIRCGVENLGCELQQKGISRQSQWGARGIVNTLTRLHGPITRASAKRTIFSSDAAVQTESVIFTTRSQSAPTDESVKPENFEEVVHLASSDLSAILQWSKDISSDINLSSALRRLTEIAAENSGAQYACVVIARDAGDYTVVTSICPPEACQVHENHQSIRTIHDPLQKAVIQHCLNTKERLVFDDASLDSRFASESHDSYHRSVICLPIFSNRGQTFGVVYLASNYAFSPVTVHVLTLLLQQASISIANALLFRSVQAGTRENLKMISAQRAALEQARQSREDALKATKVKSSFLASMSHELRTPFSSFYGLLDILGGTELNHGQREIVQTAKQSCELLLKIIDSILDYSKLEASAVKLELSGFPVENIIADCMELLLPMAARKLDMSYNIEPDVPPWVMADYARIRQVLMNLIGNAVKFTANGFVRVTCSVDGTVVKAPGEVFVKFVIQDTGIGLSKSDVELLFVPFQQADSSSTRKFGGTGLGLSISRQLVKLMGGDIGVTSELGVGSTFWFSLPVKIFDSDDSRKALAELEHVKSLLMHPQPLRMLVSSPSETTLSLLGTMLSGFNITFLSSIENVESYLLSIDPLHPALDFIIVDEQSDNCVDGLATALLRFPSPTFRETKIVHMYTPTAETLSRVPSWGTIQTGVVRMTMPPRKSRILQTLATLKGVGNDLLSLPTSDVAKAMDDLAMLQRTLYGNVLVAEDNPVAQQLIIKQLERFQLNVTATNNGIEAVNEWEAHEPGYFSVALFDHHMPLCDGIEACKKIRVAESKRKTSIALPIVALSADCQESTKQLCLSAGMNMFLSKPLRKDDLLALLSMFRTPAKGDRTENGRTSESASPR
ncbi:histidine kinase [Rickenella mellea]|uniref:Histidine kinase n=1 Tax=Rickenella mellea TaxID=50990 RepID=A0A4Y7QMN0_9AGAM|nr:histidine kinase [Rickenella mellea]